MGTLKLSVLIAVGSAYLVGCGVSEPEHKSSTSSTGVTSVGNGYRHLSSGSRFDLGATIGRRTEFGLDKTIGTNGVFSIHIATHAAIATPNAGAPCESAGPMSPGSVHTDRVRAYFETLGMPKDQIANVQLGVSSSGSGPTSGPEANMPTSVLVGYTSALSRHLVGIPVVESIAWARMNANGDICAEQVDWPDIALDVVADAQALEVMVSDVKRLETFQSKLPVKGSGRVAIHHSTSADMIPTIAFAAYDVFDGGTFRHFGADGLERLLPAERAPTPAGATTTR